MRSLLCFQNGCFTLNDAGDKKERFIYGRGKKSGIKKFLEEFKAFAMRGNVLDMAVGVVIGGAFTAIVTALVEDIINPLIGLFFKADFSDVVIGLGGSSIKIGEFVNSHHQPPLSWALYCLLREPRAHRPGARSPALRCSHAPPLEGFPQMKAQRRSNFLPRSPRRVRFCITL